MEEQNLLSPEPTNSKTTVPTNSEHSLKVKLVKNEPSEINMELESEEKSKGNLLATASCTQITPKSQHGDALDSGATNSCLSAAIGPLPPPIMPGLIPIQHTQPPSRFSPLPSISYSSSSASSRFALPDLVQVSSDSGSIDSHHGNAGRCRVYRKKRKRVLSECERDLAKMVAANSKLKKVSARLEHRVGKLKAFYIHSVLHSKYKCLNSVCMNLEK